MGLPESSLTDHDRRVLMWTVVVPSCVALAGSAFVFVTYIAHKHYRELFLRMILYLSVLDFICSATMIVSALSLNGGIQALQGNISCQVQGCLLVLTPFASCLMSGCLTHLFDGHVREHNDLLGYEKWYLSISLGLPIIYMAVALGLGAVGPTATWCYIRTTDLRMYEYVLTAAVLLYNTFASLRLSGLFRCWRTGTMLGEPLSETTIVVRMRWFVIFLWICWIPAMANRIENSLHGPTLLWLNAAEGVCLPLQGLTNACLFGANHRVAASYNKRFQSWFPCWSTGRERMLADRPTVSTSLLHSATVNY